MKYKVAKGKVIHNCPICGVNLENLLAEAGQEDTCPKCTLPFVVPGETELKESQTKEWMEEQKQESARVFEQQKAVSGASPRNKSYENSGESGTIAKALKLPKLIGKCPWTTAAVVACVSFIAIIWLFPQLILPFVVILVFGGVIGLLIWSYLLGAREKRQAWERYQSSLRKLKGDPTNANLRESALACGRHYSELTREEGKVAIFDEVAIANDINAACAAAAQPKDTRVAEKLSRAAPSDFDVRKFRIHGAEKETGEHAVFELDADTVQTARKKASEAGYLVERVELIR